MTRLKNFIKHVLDGISAKRSMGSLRKPDFILSTSRPVSLPALITHCLKGLYHSQVAIAMLGSLDRHHAIF
jgi:hypothetical protein